MLQTTNPEPNATDKPTFSEALKVTVEKGIDGESASIAYHVCLKQLAQHLLPVHMSYEGRKVEWTTWNQCQVQVNSCCCWISESLLTLDLFTYVTYFLCGLAVIVCYIFLPFPFSQMCPYGHTVWKWVSRPTLKYGMLVGDFMVASNILLLGNNYDIISLIPVYEHEDGGEVNILLDLGLLLCGHCKGVLQWEESAIITQLRSKGRIVTLGKFDSYIHIHTPDILYNL